MSAEVLTETKINEPIFCYAIFSSPDYADIPAKDHPMFLRGIYDFERRNAEPVKGILLRSLEYMGYELPFGFSIIACEVFYREEHIEEVRCCGTYVSGIAAGGEAEYAIWTTPTPPRFTMTLGREVALAPEDVGRTCVVANQTQLALTVSWDLRAHENFTHRDDADFCALMVMEQDDPPEDATQAERIRAFVTEMAEKLRGQPLEHVRLQVRSRPPADAGEHRSVVLRNDDGTLTYTYDVERVEHSLRSGYADSMRLTQASVEAHMRKLSFSEDEAKAAILLKHLLACDEFVAAGRASFEQKARRLLEDTLAYMRREVSTLALAEWHRSEGRAPRDADAMKTAALDAVVEMAKRRLEMRGRGRPEGSGNRHDEEKVNTLNREHRASILRAVESLFRKIYKATENVSAAEDAITKKAVAAEIPCSRTTLDGWLKMMQEEFEELRDEALAGIRVQ